MILEGDVEPALHVFLHPPGDANPARLGQRFQASRHVHAFAPQLGAVDDDVADIDADTEFDPLRRRHVRVAVDHRTLELDGALHCCYDAGEFHQQAVAGDPDDATLVRLDLGIDERAPVRLPLGESAGIVRSHESTVARDIGHQDGREPPLHAILTRPAEALDKLQPGGTGLCRHHRSCLHRSSPILQHQPPRRENAPRGR